MYNYIVEEVPEDELENHFANFWQLKKGQDDVVPDTMANLFVRCVRPTTSV